MALVWVEGDCVVGMGEGGQEKTVREEGRRSDGARKGPPSCSCRRCSRASPCASAAPCCRCGGRPCASAARSPRVPIFPRRRCLAGRAWRFSQRSGGRARQRRPHWWRRRGDGRAAAGARWRRRPLGVGGGHELARAGGLWPARVVRRRRTAARPAGALGLGRADGRGGGVLLGAGRGRGGRRRRRRRRPSSPVARGGAGRRCLFARRRAPLFAKRPPLPFPSPSP